MANKKNEKTFFYHVKYYCKEYCDYTGIHGFKYIGEERSIAEKICWIVVFFMSLAVCMAMVYEIYQKWQNSPVIVNFATEEANIYSIPFPTVTICPETKVQRGYFNYSRVARTLIQNKTISDEDLRKLQYMSLVCSDNDMFIKVPEIDTIDEGFYQFLLNGSMHFLKKCWWMGDLYPCDQIFRPLFTDEGLCMTFNMLDNEEFYTKFVHHRNDPPKAYRFRSAKNWSVEHGYNPDAGWDTYPRRALLSGSLNALVVNLGISHSDLDYACTNLQGYQVVLHKGVRFPTVSQHYFRIPLKKSVSAAIYPTLMRTSDAVKLYSHRKRKCFFQSEVQLKYFTYYTQYNCKLECHTNHTLKICGCVEFYMPRSRDTPICGNGKSECVKRVKENIEMSGLQYAINNKKNTFSKKDRISCMCLPMCSSTEYSVEISQTDFDWTKKMKAFGFDPYPDDDDMVSSSQLMLYFKKSHFFPYERNELYGPLDFLANVGGLFGLFIGFSLLSLVEIMYFLTVRLICNSILYKNWYGKQNEPTL